MRLQNQHRKLEDTPMMLHQRFRWSQSHRSLQNRLRLQP